MPFDPPPLVNCQDVEAAPWRYHRDDWTACSRIWYAIEWTGDRGPGGRTAEELVSGQLELRGLQACRWLQRFGYLAAVEFRPLDTFGYGFVGIAIEIDPQARVLSLRHCVDRGGIVARLPPWADDYNRWSGNDEMHWLIEGSQAGSGLQLMLKDLVEFARERHYDAVALPLEGRVLNADAVRSVLSIRHWARDNSYPVQIRRAIDGQYNDLSEAAVASAGYVHELKQMQERLRVPADLRLFSDASIARHRAMARRYLDFVAVSTDALYEAQDLRTRTERRLDIILGLKRYVGLSALAYYACGKHHGRHAGGRRLEMAARNMRLPGPSVAGRIRPRHLVGWPDTLVELVLLEMEIRIKSLRQAVQDLMAHANAWDDQRLLSDVYECLISPDVNWKVGAESLDLGSRL